MKRFACIPARAVFDLQLQPALLRTLLVLGLYTDKLGRCHVKVATVAQVLGTHPKNAQKYLRLLERAGYLRRVAQHCTNGRQRENTYELVLGGESSATPPGGVVSDSPHRERVSERVEKSPARTGPGEEDLDMNYVDLRETEGASDLAPENSRPRPTKPKAKRRPDQMNPVGLAQYFAAKTRSHQWGHPNATPIKVLAGTFRRWRDDDGVTYREIAIAIDLFFDQLPPGLEAPAGRLFIKQGFDWISKAKGDIYQQDLPKMKAASRALHQELHQLHAQWLAAHPEADQDAQDRRYSEIWMDLKTDPKYAIAYA